MKQVSGWGNLNAMQIREEGLANGIRISEILPWDRKSFLAHQVRISENLPWDRKSYLNKVI